MADAPQTRYARTPDGTYIAYQVCGSGPIDVVYVPTWINSMEHLWDEPGVARFFERFTGFGRLILFDRRGSGMSDPVVDEITLEDQMDDVMAVLDAAGSERAALFAQFEGGPMAMLFAASFPERTGALVLYATFAATVADEEVTWANTQEQRDLLVEETVASWGTGERLMEFAPSRRNDKPFQEWLGKLERLAGSPSTARRMMSSIGRNDVRSVLPLIQVPTLVLHRKNDEFINFRHSQLIASRIPGARLSELPPGDSLVVSGDTETMLDEIEEFLTGVRPAHEPDRVLATVMFTDIIDSTKRAASIGDGAWRDLIGRHDQLVRAQLTLHRGREIKTMGDGFLATFDGPARAIRCAQAIREQVAHLGIEIRAGLHTGEIEVVGDDVAGLAVNIGARVGARAGPSELLVSSTVKDLVVGSGIPFDDKGEHELKGVPGEWRLYAVAA